MGVDVRVLIDNFVRYVVEAEPLEIPKWNYDGTEVKTAEEVAVILNIPVSEAEYRLSQQRKDVYSGAAAHATGVGVGTRISGGTVYERARAMSGGKRRKKKRKKEKGAQA